MKRDEFHYARTLSVDQCSVIRVVVNCFVSLRIQVYPKKGIGPPTFLFSGWDWKPKNPILGRGLDS